MLKDTFHRPVPKVSGNRAVSKTSSGDHQDKTGLSASIPAKRIKALLQLFLQRQVNGTEYDRERTDDILSRMGIDFFPSSLE